MSIDARATVCESSLIHGTHKKRANRSALRLLQLLLPVCLVLFATFYVSDARADQMMYRSNACGGSGYSPLFTTAQGAAQWSATSCGPSYNTTTQCTVDFANGHSNIWFNGTGSNWQGEQCAYFATALCKKDSDQSLYTPNALQGKYLQCGCPTGQWDVENNECMATPKNAGSCKSGICPMEGNPIHVGWGNKVQVETDYVGSNGLTLARTYNSKQVVAIDFNYTQIPERWGLRWRSTYDRRIFVSSNNYYALAHRPDGKQLYFTNFAGWAPAEADIPYQFYNNGGGYTLRNTDTDESEFYSYAGVLQSIKSRAGVIQTMLYSTGTGSNGDYVLDANGNPTATPLPAGFLIRVTDSFGKALNFGYNGVRVVKMTDPAGNVYRYTYDAKGSPTSVIYPSSTGTVSKQYVYDEPGNASNNPFVYGNQLTGIIDENAARYATFQYDNRARAILSKHAGGAEQISVVYTQAPNANVTSSTVTDALGATRTYQFQSVLYSIKANSLSQPCAGCRTAAATFDANGNVATSTDFNGRQTTRSYLLSRNLETSRTEAATTPAARTITTQWHGTYHLPTQIDEPGKRTTFTYDSSGNTLTRTVLDTATSTSRTWTYTYNSFGQVLTVNGPRTDVSDITTYTYYSCTTGFQCGQVQTITNALNQITTFNTYNAHGQPLTITDPNGVVTTLTYDERMRLTSRTVAGETTSFEYWPTSLLKKTTLPDGSFVAYTYDDAHRLTQVQDNEGNKVVYTLDAMGNRTAENVYDPSNALTNTRTRVFNTLNRLYQEIAAAGTSSVTTTFGYDTQGNQTSINAPLSRNSTNTYDELHRLKQVTDPLSGITQYSYNALDQLISVTDPRNKVTNYTYNALGDLLTQVSPDTGTTTSTYDSGGNLKTKTDARSALVTYSYDALNRVTQAVTSDQTIVYHYDLNTNGKGRLSDLSDNSGSTSFTYDSQGRVTSKTQVMAGVSKTVSYSFDSSGRPSTLTTPAGNVITYGYTNGKVTSLTLNGSTTILSGILYEPFGPIRQWTWGNSTLTNRTFDTDGKITAIDSAGQKTLGYDDAFRITQLTDTQNSSLSQTLGYDLLDRLTSATGTNLNQSFTYDANGNRLTQGGAASSTFTISSTSNRLTSVSGALSKTYSYDNAGNATSDGGATFTFDQQGRMGTSTKNSLVTSYSYNALGQRVRKSNSNATTYFVYDEAGHLLGEYNGSGTLIQELVWLGDVPVATIRANENGTGTGVFYIHTDHLNSPRKITRPNDNAIVWRWDSDPFGNGAPNEDPDGNSLFVSFNPRFPGQYFDSETGLNYNHFRDYDPQTGRYVESDPIGLNGGNNTYGYVQGNPINLFDPTGRFAAAGEFAAGGAIFILICASTPSCSQAAKNIADTLARRLESNCPKCDEIRLEIDKKVGELRWRYIQGTVDVQNLYTERFFGKFSWMGHRFWYGKVQGELKELIAQAKAIPCTYNLEADEWAEKPFPDVPTRWLNRIR